MNQYKELLEQRDTLKQIHQRLFNQYGSMMSEEAKTINKINWDISESMYDSDIEIAYKKAMKELEDETVDNIMKRVSIKVDDKATKEFKELDKQIRNMFSK